MQIIDELKAICVLIAIFAVQQEVNGGGAGGAGTQKKAEVINKILELLQSPGGLYITSKWQLWAWEMGLKYFLVDFIVDRLHAWAPQGFLELFGKSSTSSKNS